MFVASGGYRKRSLIICWLNLSANLCVRVDSLVRLSEKTPSDAASLPCRASESDSSPQIKLLTTKNKREKQEENQAFKISVTI